MSKNYAHLEGNLGKDPELRHISSGAAVCSVSLATQYTAKDGDKGFTTWHRISAWGETAEALAQFGKGDKISVEGFIRYNEWTDRNGVKHRDAEIQCYAVKLLFKAGGKGASKPASSSKNDDLPF